MRLIRTLLPLYDNEGVRFPRAELDRVCEELTERWGGATAFLRSPAEGAWKEGAEVSRDEVVMIEVIAEEFDLEWWKRYREELKKRFRQEEIVISAIWVELL